jgi:hypothetical protein
MNKPRANILLFQQGAPSDTTRPTVAITLTTWTGATDTAAMTITFSEEVQNFAVGDISITAGGALASFATADNIVFTVNWTLTSGANTMDIAEGVCTDLAGNTNQAATQFAMGAEQTATIQPDAADTFIAKEAATSNFGTLVQFYAGDTSGGAGDHATRALIKFDVSSVSVAALVLTATMQLYEDAADNSGGIASPWTVNVHRLLKNWVEAQATWNIYSTGNNWGTGGASGDGVDRVAVASSTLAMDATPAGGFVSFTGLRADVQGFIDGSLNNYGWLIMTPTAEGSSATVYNRFFSLDYGVAGNRPKLVVTYRLANP